MYRSLGGRGKKVTYSTTTIRVPDPLVPQVWRLIHDYRLLLISENNYFEPRENLKMPTS
jgi:hypothetical protein